MLIANPRPFLMSFPLYIAHLLVEVYRTAEYCFTTSWSILQMHKDGTQDFPHDFFFFLVIVTCLGGNNRTFTALKQKAPTLKPVIKSLSDSGSRWNSRLLHIDFPLSEALEHKPLEWFHHPDLFSGIQEETERFISQHLPMLSSLHWQLMVCFSIELLQWLKYS